MSYPQDGGANDIRPQQSEVAKARAKEVHISPDYVLAPSQQTRPSCRGSQSQTGDIGIEGNVSLTRRHSAALQEVQLEHEQFTQCNRLLNFNRERQAKHAHSHA